MLLLAVYFLQPICGDLELVILFLQVSNELLLLAYLSLDEIEGFPELFAFLDQKSLLSIRLLVCQPCLLVCFVLQLFLEILNIAFQAVYRHLWKLLLDLQFRLILYQLIVSIR